MFVQHQMRLAISSSGLSPSKPAVVCRKFFVSYQFRPCISLPIGPMNVEDSLLQYSQYLITNLPKNGRKRYYFVHFQRFL